MRHDRKQKSGNRYSVNKSEFAIINKRKYFNRYTREHGNKRLNKQYNVHIVIRYGLEY